MVDVITTLSGAIALGKKLIELTSALKDAGIKAVVADLQLQLAKVTSELAEIIQENTRLKEELKLATVEAPEFRSGVYWKSSSDGPYCTVCFDKDHKLIHLADVSSDYGDFFLCQVCNKYFEKKSAT